MHIYRMQEERWSQHSEIMLHFKNINFFHKNAWQELTLSDKV